jgi:hypothetical protein
VEDDDEDDGKQFEAKLIFSRYGQNDLRFADGHAVLENVQEKQ